MLCLVVLVLLVAVSCEHVSIGCIVSCELHVHIPCYTLLGFCNSVVGAGDFAGNLMTSDAHRRLCSQHSLHCSRYVILKMKHIASVCVCVCASAHDIDGYNHLSDRPTSMTDKGAQ